MATSPYLGLVEAATVAVDCLHILRIRQHDHVRLYAYYWPVLFEECMIDICGATED